ncbi:UDP-glucuronosyltransferase 1A1-like isoform X2 [Spea bombifrons]|uniref:UDP-glucuronosyltransferase 1A1-like isoform X2 n=1 Tax=Spea bombifrons TaxID=233779 RepID=UPI00234A1AAD|nr:UDP-glucuronosyltransferase 1A1-like isoform X2 [Spea bombifrons]
MISLVPVRILFLLGPLSLAYGGRLLVFPQDGSHWLSMKSLVDKLTLRGHQIVLVIPETNFLLRNLDNYTVRTFSVPYTKEFIDNHLKEGTDDVFKKMTLPQRIVTLHKRITNYTNLVLSSCEYLLKNASLIKNLEQNGFDAALNDPVFPCGEIVAEHLAIPSVYFMRGTPFGMDQEATQSPSPPSYVPRFFTTYTDHMTFSEKMKNFIVRLTDYVFSRIFYHPYAQLASDFLKRDITAVELFSRASIWLMRYDFVFEFPRPVMPNMVFIGGINCINRNPLNQEFENLVNSSGEHGFVVFSLGSMVSEIPIEKAMDIAEALGTIPQTVIWRYTGKVPSNLAENTHLVKWLPQNDLLAHPKARAFITHAGSHGIYEGICNAVPMVMLPLFGDQMDNAVRIQSRGAGLMLNVLDMTPEDLSNALNTVINNPSYKENIQRLSALHLDRPIHPLDLAVHWVEFVMRHKGAPHLRPAAHELNFIQYHSLDVIGLLLFVILTTIFISLKCCCFVFRRCCGHSSRPMPKSKPKPKSKSQ